MLKYGIGLLAVIGLAAWLALKDAWVVALFCLFPLGWFASRLIVNGGFELWHYARHTSKAEWNGRYYEFGGQRLRAEEIDEGLVFAEEDLLAVIEQPKSKTVELFGPGERVLLDKDNLMVLTQAGCERLLTKCPHRDAKKLMLFLQREAFFPHAKRHGRAKTRVGDDNPPKTTMMEEKT
jgi:hypothetical protein